MAVTAFTEEQIERYSRQIILPEVGGIGQAKLLAARVLVVGAGGLGSPVALYLAAAGVGSIGIVDSDCVDISNLQRQILHGTADLGRQKCFSAKEALESINPDVVVTPYPVRLTRQSPIPRMSFSTSVAWMAPITPAVAPSTPASWQLGIRPGGGGSG